MVQKNIKSRPVSRRKIKHRKEQPVSKTFIISFLAIAAVLIAYIVHPSNNQAKQEIKKSLEDMIEYTVRSPKKQNTETYYTDENNENSILNDIKNIITNDEYIEEDLSQPFYNELSSEKMLSYNNLLDQLGQLPSKNETSVYTAVDRLLAFKGYPDGIVKVVISDFNHRTAGSTNDYTIANLNLLTGEMNVSRDLLNVTNIKAVIAILAHELDHFDKLAQICKSIGINKFQKIFIDNGLTTLNPTFWERASVYANIENFDKKSFTTALTRFLSQQFIDTTGSYSDFYKIAENVRNPLEISAYKESDYVYNYYKIPILEWNIRRIVIVFNDIDWNIYYLLNKQPFLKNERIAIFNYYYAKAILEKMPEFSYEFDYCEKHKDGDLTTFWNKVKNRFSGFYKQEKISDRMCDDILNLLTRANSMINSGITIFDAARALQYKMNTLKYNLAYAESVYNLRKTALDYLLYIKQEKIANPKQELNAIITLICIDNSLFTSNTGMQISLNSIQIPNELEKLYEVNKKSQKFSFIYDNSEFQSMSSKGYEAETLYELLNKSRLKVGI